MKRISTIIAVSGIALTSGICISGCTNQMSSESIRQMDKSDEHDLQSLIDNDLPNGNYRLILNSPDCSNCHQTMADVQKKYPSDKLKNIYVSSEDEKDIKAIKKLFDTTDIFKKKRTLPLVVKFKINDNHIIFDKFDEIHK